MGRPFLPRIYDRDNDGRVVCYRLMDKPSVWVLSWDVSLPASYICLSTFLTSNIQHLDVIRSILMIHHKHRYIIHCNIVRNNIAIGRSNTCRSLKEQIIHVPLLHPCIRTYPQQVWCVRTWRHKWKDEFEVVKVITRPPEMSHCSGYA